MLLLAKGEIDWLHVNEAKAENGKAGMGVQQLMWHVTGLARSGHASEIIPPLYATLSGLSLA